MSVARTVGRSFFSRGEGTLSIPYEMHRRHRESLVKALTDAGHASNGFLFLNGGAEKPVYDTDTTWDFKQESNFQWLFGVKEVGVSGALNLKTGDAFLFIPRQPDFYAQWMGPIKPTEWFAETYEVEHVHYADEIADTLAQHTDTLVVPKGKNMDSGAEPLPNTFEGMSSDRFKTVQESEAVYHQLAECRVVKDATELEIMQFTCDVSSQAHIITMREAQRGDRRKEYQSEAEFKYQSFLRGCSRVGYSCICPAGPRNATLHYGHPGEPNEHTTKDGDMKLHDMGAEYHGYTADVTCSFPIGGKFTPEQASVYNAVWAAVVEVEEACRPGVEYTDLHFISQRVMLRELKKGGLFTGEVEEMLEAGVMAIFMPHGLGHQLGLDVHDVGGYLPGQGKEILKDTKPYPITQNLRCSRKMKEGMVFTVEPGFYFNAWLMDKLRADAKLMSYINAERLEQLIPVGGIRIEDNVVATKNGCRVLNNVPRTVAEIEAVIAGQEWDVHTGYRVYGN